MDTQLTTTTDAVIVGVPMMDEGEARESIELMRADMGMVENYADSFRRRALDFAEREGWRALGYPGAIVAIQTELGTQYSKSYLSRLLQAAEIERVLELPIGNAVPESVLREVAKIETSAQQRAVYQAATANGTPTAKQVQQAASEIAGWVCDICGQLQTGMRKPNPAHCTMCAMRRLDQAMRPESPDLPIDFAIVQRRLARHGIALTHRMQNGVLLFQRQQGAGTPISTMEWSYVLEKLALLEDAPPPPPSPLPRSASATIAAYDQQERADNEIIREAIGMLSAARALLSSVAVATYARDQAARPITIESARAYLICQQERLTHFSAAGMLSQASFKEALEHIASLIEVCE